MYFSGFGKLGFGEMGFGETGAWEDIVQLECNTDGKLFKAERAMTLEDMSTKHHSMTHASVQ